MQTFLPYPDFHRSAACLDPQRLGKQRVEVLQLLTSIEGDSARKPWRNHPAAKMWYNHPHALADYGRVICLEWMSHGYSDTCFDKITELELNGDFWPIKENELPPWFGDPAFHISHQSNLLRKNPEWYRNYFIDIPDDLPYVWPV